MTVELADAGTPALLGMMWVHIRYRLNALGRRVGRLEDSHE